MYLIDLQERLQALGYDTGGIDGIFGLRTHTAILLALTDGADNQALPTDFTHAATTLSVTTAHIRAVWMVEAAGAGFIGGRPKVLFEPHRFSRATGHVFDRTHPTISYPRWGERPYPKTQAARYDQIRLAARALAVRGHPVDPAFASASWGAPQILGENFAACGFSSPWEMAFAFSQSEADQLFGFVNFLKSNPAILRALQNSDFANFARLYNGPAFRKNSYDTKIAAAFRKFSA